MQHRTAGQIASQATAKVALVSGAASGIGLATVHALAAAGWVVYAGFRTGGRSLPPAAAVPGAPVRWLALDVTKDADRSAALATISTEYGRLDALVNNAGILTSGPLEEVTEARLRAVMEVNFFGAIGLSRTFLPLMRTSRGGVVVMVSSLSRLIGLPFDGAYAASKFALEGASESLRYELEPMGIKVALIEPGAYATSLDAQDPAPVQPTAYPQFEQLRRLRANPGRGADPAAAARVIIDTIAAHAPLLRVPCGPQAVAVTEKLRALEGPVRRDFALAAAGVAADR